MDKKRLLFVLLFCCFLLAHFPQLNSAIRCKKQKQDDLQYEVSVTLKLIQVYVTDKEGNPVLDLDKSDFILYDNGELKEITDFEKHILAKKELKTQVELSSEISSRMNRKFLILLDILGNDEVGVLQSKKAAIHFIDTQLRPGDEVGILSFAPLTGLNLNTYFTTDPEKIKQAIKDAKEVSATKWEGPTMEQLKAESEAEALAKHSSSGQKGGEAGSGQGLGGDSSTTSMFVRPFQDPGLSKIKKNPLHLLMEATELSKTLRYIPGIKHILFFSGGGPEKFRKFYERLGMELAESNCLVHAINAMGTRSNFMRWSGPSKETLEELARASGGKYFEDVSDYENLAADIQNLSGNYYVLGYYISEKEDGRYHKIRVDVKQEDRHVYAQGGYFNPIPFTKFSEFEKKLHLIDLALSDKPYFQDPLDIPLITLPCSNDTELNCVLLSRLPITGLGVTQGQKIEIINIICDEKKNIIDSSRGEVDYSKLRETGVFQYTILSLPPGRYECRVAMRNLVTGKGAFGLSPVTIPPEQESGLALFSPLLLIPDINSRFLKLSPEKEKTKDREGVSLDQIYPFISNRHSPLIHKLENQTRRIFAVLRCASIDIQHPEIELYGSLVSESTGDKTPLSFRVASSRKQGDTEVILIDIALPVLESGRYAIEFSARESVTDSRSVVTRTFIIK